MDYQMTVKTNKTNADLGENPKMIDNTGKSDGQHAIYLRRVDACAIIALADKTDKIAAIAQSEGICIGKAARIYVNGALKRAVNQGRARNRTQALDQFEAEQAGDTSRPLAVQSGVSKEVARLKRMTGSSVTIIYSNGTIMTVEPPARAKGKSHQSDHGKVYGELYTRLEATEIAYRPDAMYDAHVTEQLEMEVDIHCRRFIAEYTTRLSAIGRRWIEAIKAAPAIDTTREGRNTKLGLAVKHLVSGFPVKVSAQEYIELIRKYA